MNFSWLFSRRPREGGGGKEEIPGLLWRASCMLPALRTTAFNEADFRRPLLHSFTSCINIPFLCRHSILNSLSLILKRNKLVLWPSMSSFKLRSLKETFIYWEHLSLASQSLQTSYPGSLISPPSRSEERGEERAGRWETLGTRLNLSQLWITTMPVKLTWVLLRKHASEIILLAKASDNIYDVPVRFSPLISWVTKRSLGGTAPIPSGVMVKNDHGWQITS